jgi:hypothetical protein
MSASQSDITFTLDFDRLAALGFEPKAGDDPAVSANDLIQALFLRPLLRDIERRRKRKVRVRQSPEEKERDGARDRLRKRQFRARQLPEVTERERVRKVAARKRQPARPFLAIDGEGGGTDALGRQNYLLMVAANDEHELICHRAGKALSVRDCLEFIASLPANRILVGFGIGYDAYPYPAKAGCRTVAGNRRTRLAPPGRAPAVSWS